MKVSDRYKLLEEKVFESVQKMKEEQKLPAVIHLSGVATLCSLLAAKRNLDVELCRSAGLLHDLWLFCNCPVSVEQHVKHGFYGSLLAEKILRSVSHYSEEEIATICKMIENHNDKDVIQSEYDEILKDADALQHYLNGGAYDAHYRYNGHNTKVLCELGVNPEFAYSFSKI